MKHRSSFIIYHSSLVLALTAIVLMFAACKPDPIEPSNVERDITYTVDGNLTTVHLNTDAEWDALLNHFCKYIEGGSTVSFYNGKQAPRLLTKEASTYSTSDREAMKRWMRQMEEAGKTVTVTYDSDTGTYIGTAYATVPQSQGNSPFDSRGATISLFTVSEEGNRVHFSRSNLQYYAATDVWRFQNNQYSFRDNSGEWIDLFTWEADGTMPWMTGCDTLFSGLAGQWRILTEPEWQWLLEWRTASSLGNTTDARYAPVTVGGIRGLLIFPDSYTHPASVTLPVDINTYRSTSWDENDYNLGEWGLMEDAGAVFLPMAGYINDGSAMYANTRGRYWVYCDISRVGHTVLAIDTDLIPGLSGLFIGTTGWWGDMGSSVRLVCSE